MGDPVQHFHNPVLAGLDLLSAIAVVGWWFDILHTPIGVISTALAACWYAFSLYVALEKRIKGGKDKD